LITLVVYFDPNSHRLPHMKTKQNASIICALGVAMGIQLLAGAARASEPCDSLDACRAVQVAVAVVANLNLVSALSACGRRMP
jgi:uncharacterized metal-binding protein